MEIARIVSRMYCIPALVEGRCVDFATQYPCTNLKNTKVEPTNTVQNATTAAGIEFICVLEVESTRASGYFWCKKGNALLA